MKYVDKAVNGDVLMVTVERVHGQEKRTYTGAKMPSVDANQSIPGREDVKIGLNSYTK